MQAEVRKSKKLVFVIVIQLLAFLTHAAAKELIFANAVWRHGDRSYMKTYPTDPYKNRNIWKNGPGQLTNIGMKEQQELGKFLRSRYDKLLSDEYLRDQLYVRSTDKDRTIMSALSNMAGLYPPTRTELWNGSSTNWIPIPVHTVPIDQDKLLRYPNRNCPKYNKIMSKIRHSQWYLEHEKKYAFFYDFIRRKTGLKYPCNLTNIWEVEDNLFCLKSNNYTLPPWANDTVLARLKHLNSLEMGLMFTDPDYKYLKTISKMQGGVLLKQIVQNLTEHVNGVANHSLIAYSAHDTTVTALLAALDSYDWVQPGYASCVMLELYEDKGEHFVEMYYRKSNGTMIQLKFYDCQSSCPFDEFVKISQDLIPDDHDEVCGIIEESRFICDMTLIIITVLLFVFIIVSIALRVYCKKSHYKSEYRRIVDQDDSI